MAWTFFKRKPELPRKGVGLAFGGGSIRCIAHVGVYNALTKHAIPVDYVAGTSAGSIIAALVAAGFSSARISEVTTELDWFSMISPHLNMKGLFSSRRIYDLMRKLLPIRYFGETKIPLSIATTDIVTGKEVVFNKPEDEIALAVQASCTVPGLFAPVRYKQHELVDGCLVNNVPVSLLHEMQARYIIGVNVVPHAPMPAYPKNVFEVFSRVNDIYQLRSVPQETLGADIVITPLQQYVSVLKPSKNVYIDLINQGYTATERVIPKILKAL